MSEDEQRKSETEDEVEAHMRKGAADEAGDEADGDDDVEAHMRKGATKKL